jgi:probable HAF family extracellular repeat protein
VVGFSSDPSGVYRGFVWDGTRMIDAGALPGLPYTQLFAINAAGVSVGTAFNVNGVQRGIVYAGGRLLDVNSVVESTPYTITALGGIDAAGDLVGTGVDNGTSRAVILRPE